MRMARKGRAALWVLCGVLGVACGREPEGASRAERPAGRGVLVVAIDAFRADQLSLYGYERTTTPYLERLAGESAVFDSAWSSGPGIIPAHVSLLTGCDPLIARVPPIVTGGGVVASSTGWFIPERVPRLAVEFLAAGWRTAAFVDHSWIGSLRGFDQGFSLWDDAGGGRGATETEFGIRGVGSRFLEWLKGRPREERWFAYVHMNDLERLWSAQREAPDADRTAEGVAQPVGEAEPIFFAVPPSRFDGTPRSLEEYRALYDEALVALDRNLKRLFWHLERSGRWDRTTVVIVGSFGVGFGETGLVLDSGTLSDADLRVPLLVRPEPGLAFDARRVDDPVSLVDVAPTLLALGGIEPARGMHGVSLLPAMRSSDAEAGVSREYVFASCFLHEGFAVMDGRYCYERSQPGVRSASTLSASWFGDDRPHRDFVREVLHDRFQDPRAGHLGLGVSDADRAARMRAAGEDWYGLVQRATEVLHRVRWDAQEELEAEIDILRERGLLGDP